MSKKYLQELIKNLQQFYKCPACDTNYHLDDIKFLGEMDALCIVQFSCHDCSLPVLGAFGVDGYKPRKRSDLKASEQTKFASMGEISSGEIAEFHRYISDMRGGLTKLG